MFSSLSFCKRFSCT